QNPPHQRLSPTPHRHPHMPWIIINSFTEKQGKITTVIFSEGYSEDTGRTRKSKIGNVERTEKYREITRCVLGVPRCTENCSDSTVYYKKILYSAISRIQTDKKCSRQDYPARQSPHFNSKLDRKSTRLNYNHV